MPCRGGAHAPPPGAPGTRARCQLACAVKTDSGWEGRETHHIRTTARKKTATSLCSTLLLLGLCAESRQRLAFWRQFQLTGEFAAWSVGSRVAWDKKDAADLQARAAAPATASAAPHFLCLGNLQLTQGKGDTPSGGGGGAGSCRGGGAAPMPPAASVSAAAPAASSTSSRW